MRESPIHASSEPYPLQNYVPGFTETFARLSDSDPLTAHKPFQTGLPIWLFQSQILKFWLF